MPDLKYRRPEAQKQPFGDYACLLRDCVVSYRLSAIAAGIMVLRGPF